MREEVILVDESDKAIGVMEKMEAHQKGLLHRALSVFIFNDNKKMLLQRRALTKYHSAGLWSNACCSHPRPGEDIMAAATRRLKEEMGLETKIQYVSSFIYKTEFSNNLTEHEFDHVFKGITNLEPVINPEEADSYKWLTVKEIKSEINAMPGEFTSWFKIAMEKLF